MAQSGGYLLAASGPLAFGLLHSLTGGWEASIWLLLPLVIPELVCGLVAARPGFAGLDTTRPHGRPRRNEFGGAPSVGRPR
jgi:CP family cyanate transporter-like MFS transporter